MRARAIPALLASVALIGAACSDDRPESATTDPDDASTETTETTGTRSTGGSSGGGGGAFPQALVPFADCSTFLAHIRAEAAERVGPWGLDMEPVYWIEDDVVFDEAGAMTAEEPAEEPADEPAMEAAMDTADGAAAPVTGDDDSGSGDFTGTNVQELGVDEADIVKTDGQRILVLDQNVLTYVDVSGGDPVVRDRLRLDLGWGHEMFFVGDRAFVLTNGGVWGGPMPVEPLVVEGDVTADAEAEFARDDTAEQFVGSAIEGPAAVVIEIDLSDPSSLSIAGTLQVQGQYLSARAIGDHVRLAVASGPTQLPWVYPQSEAGEERAERTNREIIEESTLDHWLPGYALDTAAGTTSGQLLECGRVHRPAEFAGFDTVSVIDLDIAEGLPSDLSPADATGVLAGGQTVYSSTDRFYVATTEWVPSDLPDPARDTWTDEFETQIHAFSIAPGEPTEYVASGSVDGSLLNQFAMDEHEGFLRVLTTTGTPWNQSDLSETGLVVLEEQGDRLAAVGEVGGLGRGEQLYSARLMGDIGFAVTFRQIDPFYVLDLSDPTNPRVTGELKIPGVSTYLHPVGDDRVLGIGQDATEEGVTTGLKLSLFDVSDPVDPREVSVWTLPDAGSPVEYDHRAFQMWGSTAIVPVEGWNEPFNGAIVFDIGDTITEIGRVDHVPDDAAPSSDCRPVTADLLTPESSELWWMVAEAYGHVQICGPDDVGGWGSWGCDSFPADDLRMWYWDDQAATTDLGALDIAEGDRVEMCWEDGSRWQYRIVRSLIIDDTLWTVSPAMLQANRLDGLTELAGVALG